MIISAYRHTSILQRQLITTNEFKRYISLTLQDLNIDFDMLDANENYFVVLLI